MPTSSWIATRESVVLPKQACEQRFLIVERGGGALAGVPEAVAEAGGRVDVVSDPARANAALARTAHSVVLVDAQAACRSEIEALVRSGRAALPSRAFVLLTHGESVPFDLTGLDVPEDAIVGVLRRPLERRALVRVLSDAAALKGQRGGAGCDDLVVPLGRVLLIEGGDAAAAELTRRLSGIDGLSLHRVRELSEAELALLGEAFSLALVELNLPDARGFDVLHRLRALRPELPVVVLSSLCGRVRARALSLGAQEVVDRFDRDPQAVYHGLLRAKLRGDAQRELRHLATHDALTGLRNGAAFREQLTLAIARVRRQGGACGLLYVDLDGFKPINDEHGHDAGDAALRTAGQRLRSVLRDCDMAARLGGDEFAALLQDVSGTADAAAAAERVLSAMSVPLRLPDGSEVRVTASIGVAICPGTAGAAHPLLCAADAAMFRAKQAGKNRYELAPIEREGGEVSDLHILPRARSTASR